MGRTHSSASMTQSRCLRHAPPPGMGSTLWGWGASPHYLGGLHLWATALSRGGDGFSEAE